MIMNGDLRKRLAHYFRGTSPEDILERYTTKGSLLKDHDYMLKEVERYDAMYNTTLVSEPEIVLPDACRVQLMPSNRVRILDLIRSIDRPIKGKFLLCRTVSPPLKMAAVVVVADDPEGEFAVRFSMYNIFPPTSRRKLIELLPVGTIMAVKNPYFKTSADGGFGLRTDSPGDIIFLNEIQCQEYFPAITWNGEIPKMYSNLVNKSTPKTAEDWKTLGNDYFSKKNYVGALNAYTTGLKEEPRSICLLSNRAAAYLQVQAYKLALGDTCTVLQIVPNHVKAKYRKVKALCGLKWYDQALKFLAEVKSSNIRETNQTDFKTLESKVKSYIHQQKTGEYDVPFMFRTVLNNSAFVFDYADYVGPVKMRESLGKGRGLFATEDIKMGQLLIGAKAFALNVPGDDPNETSNLNVKINTSKLKVSVSKREDEALSSLVARILTLAPEKGAELYRLYAGPNFDILRAENGDDTTLVDCKRIKRICTFNAFEAKEEDQVRKSHEGIWLLPSFINHSCFDCNSNWIVFGDFMLVRAVKPIATGEEILISYIQPDFLFKNRMEMFEKRRFICDCRLCEMDHKDTRKTHLKRERWIMDVATLLECSAFGVVEDISILKYYVNRVMSLRAKNPELNIYLCAPLMALGINYMTRSQFARAIEVLEKMYDLTKDTVMCDLNIRVVTEIITYLIKGSMLDNVENWVETLKERVLLTYGSLGVMDFHVHCISTRQVMQEKGFSL